MPKESLSDISIENSFLPLCYNVLAVVEYTVMVSPVPIGPGDVPHFSVIKATTHRFPEQRDLIVL